MNNHRLEVFQAQVENVRALESGIRQLRRTINLALRRNDAAGASCHTRLYALTFCAWAEANFVKVVCTPHGFAPDEIDQILGLENNLSISDRWKKAVELGLRHLDARRGKFQPNARQKLERAIDAHVFEPSLLRNKLAHGQWATALNRQLTSSVKETSLLIAELSITQIDGWMSCHRLLAELVESLIESPKKMFMRDWDRAVQELDAAMTEQEGRTLAEHVRRLKLKPTKR